MNSVFRIGVVSAILAATLPVSALAFDKEPVFRCKNIWNQSIEVSVPAASVDEARKLLKSDSQYEDYSMCAYVRMQKPKPKRKHRNDDDEDLDDSKKPVE